MLLYGFSVKDLKDVDWQRVALLLKDFDADYYKEFLKDIGDSSAASIEEWFSNYESEGRNGLGAFLYDYICKKEDIRLNIDDPDDVFVGISADAPWSFSGKIKDMSKEQFSGMLKKYIQKITKDEVTIRWWNVNDEADW